MGTIAPITEHHPAMLAFEPWSGRVPAGFYADFLGCLTRRSFQQRQPISTAEQPAVRTSIPPFSEHYVESISVLSAVLEADQPFRMMELGAGYGAWTVRAAQALRRLGKPIGSLVAVEAEPTHFAFLKQHVADNDLDPATTRLIAAAVAPEDGEVFFTCGAPEVWYGQAIMPSPSPYPDFDGEPVNVNAVRAVSLQRLLADFEFVDLLHADLQGVEDAVFAAARGPLDQKVRRVCIGTHGPEIEANLRQLFSTLGWHNEIDVPLGEDRETPWGTANFVDGVQSWVNPRFRVEA